MKAVKQDKQPTMTERHEQVVKDAKKTERSIIEINDKSYKTKGDRWITINTFTKKTTASHDQVKYNFMYLASFGLLDTKQMGDHKLYKVTFDTEKRVKIVTNLINHRKKIIENTEVEIKLNEELLKVIKNS